MARTLRKLNWWPNDRRAPSNARVSDHVNVSKPYWMDGIKRRDTVRSRRAWKLEVQEELRIGWHDDRDYEDIAREQRSMEYWDEDPDYFDWLEERKEFQDWDEEPYDEPIYDPFDDYDLFDISRPLHRCDRCGQVMP